MKKTNLKFVPLALFGVVMLLLQSCSNETAPAIPEQKESQEANFGTVHNEVAAEILESLISFRSRGDCVTITAVHDACIEKATIATVAKDCNLQYAPTKIQITDISAPSVDAIKSTLSISDRSIVNGIMTLVSQKKDPSVIKRYVQNNSITAGQCEAALNFFETYEASVTYWEENKDEWIEYLNANVASQTQRESKWYDKIRWGDVAMSDAYYAWYGTVSTGGNIYVGAGAAAVGSVFTVLNQM